MNTTSVSRGYVRFGEILSGIHSEPSTVGLLSPGSDPAARPHREVLTAVAAELGIEGVSQAFAGKDDEVLR